MSPPEETRGSRAELKILSQKDEADGQWEEVTKTSSENEIAPEEYALVSKITYKKKDGNTKIKKLLEINSPELIAIIQKVVNYYPSAALNFDLSLSIKAPYAVLYHHLAELKAYKAEGTAKIHLELLLDYIQKELKQTILDAERLISAGFITFDLLWTIFEPGKLIYHHENEHARLYRLERVGKGDDRKKGKFFELHVNYTDYDGVNVGQASAKLKIWMNKSFFEDDPTEIRKLPLHPLSFRDGQEKLKQDLTIRGEEFLKQKGVRVMQYEGTFLHLKEPPHTFYDPSACAFDGVWLPTFGVGRVVVDPKTFCEESDAQSVRVSSTKTFGKTLGDEYIIVNDPMLCPPFVYGYSLEMKEWARFFVVNLSEPHFKEDPFKDLVLPNFQKRVIKALVNSHEFPTEARDEAQLKGKGLVVLLHGTPGSGKTLTAETVAEHTKKALMVITSGELGTWEHRLQMKLKQLLRYAAIWKAVVLIDETDVFLEQRSGVAEGELERNSLVAAFLRQLEYFQGIIFMTSNRVEVLDPAVKSRIHLALKFTLPELEVRRTIWRQAISTLPKDLIDFEPEEAVEKLAEFEMNGREIMNTTNSAATLARDEKAKIKIEHLSTMIEIWKEFEKTMRDIEKK